MVRIQGFLRRAKRHWVGAGTSDSEVSEPEAAPSDATDPEATDESRTRERRPPSLNEALVLETGSDPYLTTVGDGDLSPADIPAETGFTPKEYVEYAISATNGRLTREALLDHTGWSSRVAQQLLSEMEDNRRVVRITLGRITLVCLPDAVPKQPSIGKRRSEPVEETEELVETAEPEGHEAQWRSTTTP